MQYKVRKNETEIEFVESLSDEYKDHFLFENYKGNLAIAHVFSGLMLSDDSYITNQLGFVTYDNWNEHVDLAIQLIQENIPNIKGNNLRSVGGGELNAPVGSLQNILNEFKL